MITNNTYYKDEIFIPHAQPSVNGAVSATGNEVQSFIDKYEEDALIKCLSYKLAMEFIANLDPTKDIGLKDGFDSKWDHLLNGHEYEYNGETKTWRGLRWKRFNEDEYGLSFLADYVYYFYERSDYITRSDVGHQVEVAANADGRTPAQAVTEAWNRFVTAVQGSSTNQPAIYTDEYGAMVGADYYGNKGNEPMPLYDFINEYNKVYTELYGEEQIEDVPFRDFECHVWNNINQFGI